MKIHVASSIGHGPTDLAAFDSALFRAGIANYNLLRLSSVIPEGAALIHHSAGLEGVRLPGAWGDRLYVVMADARAATAGTEAWAGIGWVQDPTSGRGLFVEHAGTSQEMVKNLIERSLAGLQENRGVHLGPTEMRVAGTVCTSDPVCAMAVAVYQVSDWQNVPHCLESFQEGSKHAGLVG